MNGQNTPSRDKDISNAIATLELNIGELGNVVDRLEGSTVPFVRPILKALEEECASKDSSRAPLAEKLFLLNEKIVKYSKRMDDLSRAIEI